MPNIRQNVNWKYAPAIHIVNELLGKMYWIPMSEMLYCMKGGRNNGFVELTCELLRNPRPEDASEVIHVTREYSPVQVTLKLGKASIVQNPLVGFCQSFPPVVSTDNIGDGF